MKYAGVIFFDLDGTLLNNQSIIDEDNKKMLAELTAKNYLTAIASGRSPKEIETITAGTAIHSYISLNGQYIVVDGKPLAKFLMHPTIIEKITNLTVEYNHSISFYGEDAYYINRKTQDAVDLYQLDNAPFPKIEATYYQNNPVYMLYLFNSDETFDHLYQKAFENELTFYRDSPYSMAIVNKGNSKQKGIKLLCDAYDIDLSKTIAFGDGNNDLSMFEIVGTSVAMGNAKSSVKAAADIVTDTNINGGIRKALKDLGILS